ncbi:MAG: HNH endonuclease [Candidatus Eisenbacteria bacterium]
MKCFSLSHLADHVLLRDLATLVAQDRHTTASMLAHLAEVDARKLYLPAAYPSMYAYCVGELRLSEDAAAKRIQAARVGRRFPAIFTALAEGRLHLAAVCLLAPNLAPENARELIESATHKTKAEIELLLAQRFPQPDLVASVEPIPATSGPTCSEAVRETRIQHAPGHVVKESARLTPLAPQRFAVQVTIGQETHDKLRYAQALLGHAVPTGDLAAVIDRALDALIPRLEQRRFAATARTRPGRRSKRARHVPADVRRAVWERDGGQCTFVAESGRRCEARTRLEFDHVHPVARGGDTTADNMRLRCRAHNQFEAERVFGEAFMRGKRENARARAAEKRARRAARASTIPNSGLDARASASPNAARATLLSASTNADLGPRASASPNAAAVAPVRASDPEHDVTPWLRALGFRADEARRAAARCDAIPGASLEERVRVALSSLAPARARRPASLPSRPSAPEPLCANDMRSAPARMEAQVS